MRNLDQKVKFIFRWDILKINFTFETRNRSRFLRHFHVRIWRAIFTSLSADEFQLNSKSALYVSASIF